MLHFDFDWKNPNYSHAFRQRISYIDEIRARPEELPALKAYYKANIADFISDFGMTFDPRNADIGLPTSIPFILFPRQREWINWTLEKWHSREPGLCEKSRELGVTWLAMSLACSLCIFYEGVSIGFTSYNSDYVDTLGDMKSLLPKGRMFMRNLPEEFRAGFVEWRDAPQGLISFPDTGSIIGGESGDKVGRGDRRSIYFCDEAAHHPRPALLDMALSQTTNCRIDISSVNGMANPFAKKRWSGKVDVFIFDWREDPRKDDEWYAKQCAELDPVVVAQEIDRDYSASVHGIVIPGPWVRAAIDAHVKLGIAPSGDFGMALDVADEGADKNAICRAQGVEIIGSDEWSGKGGDIYTTVARVFDICDEHGYLGFRYDADGLGAGVRGDARILNEARRASGARQLDVSGFRGSEAVFDPDGIVDGTVGQSGDRGRTNKDYFQNRKSQGWWALRKRFQKTYRWIVEGVSCPPDDIISINSKCPNHMKLVAELSQPTYSTNGVGKILINKKPDGMKSPNLADATMIRFAPMDPPQLRITGDILSQVMRAGRRRY